MPTAQFKKFLKITIYKRNLFVTRVKLFEQFFNKIASDKNKKKQSISKNLTFGIVITLIVVSTLVISASFFYASHNAKVRLENKADELLRSISQSLEFSLWNFDEDTVREIGESYSHNDLIASVKIIDSLGNVYYERDKNIDAPLINRSSNVFRGNRAVGHIDIALTSQFYKEIGQQFVWSSAFVIVINLLSLIVLVQFLIHRFLKKPLDYFSDIVSSYGAEKYDLQKNHTNIKEFQPFIAVLNEMGEKISAQMSELKKAHDELEMRVEARTIELEKANEDLEKEIIERKLAEDERMELLTKLQRAQKMEAIGTLAGGVAHDLNNILSGVVSYPELLLLNLPPDSPHRNSVLTIQKSGKKAAAIVQDMLTLARRGVAIKEIININQIISDYIKSPEYNELLSFHPGVQMVTDLDPKLLNIMGSSVHLTKTIMNLVSNAVEAMVNGGEVNISTRNRYVDTPILGYDEVREGDYAVVCISDQGIGMLEEERERIFEPFYTKKTMGRSGTGLGMAVVWGTVKDHNGYIDMQTEEGQGTSFYLYFPVTREELSTAKAYQPISDYKGDKESILIIDDVKEQRQIASEMLTILGYTVTTVASGEEAVEHMKKQSADLLILDMIMDPGMNGRETYEKILQYHPRQKAILASGFSETDEVAAALRLGAGQYVKKPYTLEIIGLAVQKELNKQII